MDIFFEQYVERLGELHAAIRREIQGLTPETLDLTPGPQMNSLAVLVVHLTGAERYWIGDVACQDPSHRDREAEFHTREVEAAWLIQRLDDSLAYARRALSTLTLADLEATRVSPRDGRLFRLSWALLHTLEHSGIHLGHIQLTRQLVAPTAERQP